MPLIYRHNPNLLVTKIPRLVENDPDPPSTQENQPMTAKKKAGTGVISTIIAAISREQGASTKEIMAILTRKFPDRDADGMLATTRIQANRNCSSKAQEEKRGLVYFNRRAK
jgi:hypothetical protein